MQARNIDPRIAVMLALALLMRLLGIVTRPIWYDEAFSILFAEKGLSAMLYGTLTVFGGGAAEEHPLGYYVLLSWWMRAFGESLIAARLLSIVAGVISVYLIYLIALEALSDRRTARLSLLFAAFAPFQIHYAQEIRMYSWLEMWLLLATFAYQRGSKTRHGKWWVVFSISGALAQYTHHLAAFYLIALALLPVLQKDWRTLRAVIVAAIGSLILYSPWLFQLPVQFSKIQNAYWVERPDISKVFTLLLVFITNTPLPAHFVAVALAAVLIVVIIGFVQTMRYSYQTKQSDGLWLLYLSFAPPIFLFLFSQWRAIYIERALLPSGAIFCIWLAWVIAKTNLLRIVQYSLLGLLGIVFALGIYQHLIYHDFPYGPFQKLDTSLHQRLEARDVIVHSNKLSILPAIFFDRDLPQSFIADVRGSPTDTLAPATQEVLKVHSVKNIQSATQNADRVWYIVYQAAIDEYIERGNSTHPDIEYLDTRYSLKSAESWDGLKVLLYTKQP